LSPITLKPYFSNTSYAICHGHANWSVKTYRVGNKRSTWLLKRKMRNQLRVWITECECVRRGWYWWTRENDGHSRGETLSLDGKRESTAQCIPFLCCVPKKSIPWLWERTFRWENNKCIYATLFVWFWLKSFLIAITIQNAISKRQKAQFPTIKSDFVIHILLGEFHSVQFIHVFHWKYDKIISFKTMRSLICMCNFRFSSCILFVFLRFVIFSNFGCPL